MSPSTASVVARLSRYAWIAVPIAVGACSQDVQTLEVLSEPYTIDRIYRSMQGPSATVDVQIPSREPELVWITGYRAEVVGPDGTTLLPPEFMCHSNLGLKDVRRHARLFGWSKLSAHRLFTVSQGQTDLQFPTGFGIPILTSEPLTLTTQVLNHNRPDTVIQARVRVTIEYVSDRDVGEEMTPLYMKSANGLVRLGEQDGHFGAAMAHATTPGAELGMSASHRIIEDEFGRHFAGHWIVPPGRQENTTDVTNWMHVTRDARVHFIAVHVHPFAESLALWDRTSGDTLFTSHMERPADRIGLTRVPSFSSAEGMVLAADHDYSLTSVYRNTSGIDQEAMVVMYLYLQDDEFRNPLAR